jgi:hypothetical protein
METRRALGILFVLLIAANAFSAAIAFTILLGG